MRSGGRCGQVSEFLDAAFGFPTVLFSFLLVVVIGYWLVVAVLGSIDVDSDADAGGFSGFVAGLGLGGPPVAVVCSLLIAVAWFVCLAGTVLLDRAGPQPLGLGLAPATLALLLLAVALVAAWVVTRLLVLLLRRALPTGPVASRSDFVGALCVIRTGRVTVDFGQAEVRAADGSSAVIQVRQTGSDRFTAGSVALIYDYDPVGEFFWVTPIDPSLDPSRSLPGSKDL